MNSRRTFLTGMTAGATALAAGVSCTSKPKTGDDNVLGASSGETIVLGRTGLRVSRIGFGAAHFTKDKEKSDAVQLVRTILDSGINLIDTAYNYGRDNASWRYLAEAIKDVSRDEYILSNKHEIEGDWKGKPVEEQVDESLKIIGVDHFDIFHVHGIRSYDRCVAEGFIEDFVRMRDKGKIRFLGVTSHIHPEMIRILKHYPEVDVIMGGMNIMREHYYFDRDARLLNDYAHRHNLGILSMKPFLMGAMTQNQPAALKYAMTQPMSVPIPGMTETGHVTMNVRAAREFSALSPDDQQEWRKPETLLDGPACTGCGYCINGDSDPVDVPQLVKAAQYGERFGLKQWLSKDRSNGKLKDDLSKITPEMAKRYAHKCPVELPVEELLNKSGGYV
ncbi:aldo/keto reductase [Candidatus Latescibacterota bacterium]